MNEVENELLDIFVEMNREMKAGRRLRIGTYADRAITLLNKAVAKERERCAGLLTEWERSARASNWLSPSERELLKEAAYRIEHKKAIPKHDWSAEPKVETTY